MRLHPFKYHQHNKNVNLKSAYTHVNKYLVYSDTLLLVHFLTIVLINMINNSLQNKECKTSMENLTYLLTQHSFFIVVC